MTRKMRVLLADDHPIVREGLKANREAQPDMEVVEEAASGAEGAGRRRSGVGRGEVAQWVAGGRLRLGRIGDHRTRSEEQGRRTSGARQEPG